MQWLMEAAIVVALFILRLGIPLVVIVLVGYALRVLDTRWHMEALARRQQLLTAKISNAQGSVALPATVKSLIQEPCWEYRACPETVRARCPAYLFPQLPCWIARRQTGGQLCSECCSCAIFTTAPRKSIGVAA